MRKLLSALILSLALASPALAGKKNQSRAPASDCENAKCPMAMIHCEPPLERVDVREEGACCPKWKCEEPGAEDKCRFAKCPKRFVQCKPGERKVDMRKEGACCPSWRCLPADEVDNHCRNAKCPLAMIHCPRPKKRIDVRKPGACCPKWKCVNPDEVTEDAMATEHGEEEEAEEQE